MDATALTQNPQMLQMAMGAMKGMQQSDQMVPIGHGFMMRSGKDLRNVIAGAGQGAIAGQLESILQKKKLESELDMFGKKLGLQKGADIEMQKLRDNAIWNRLLKEQEFTLGRDATGVSNQMDIMSLQHDLRKGEMTTQNQLLKELERMRSQQRMDEYMNKSDVDFNDFMDTFPGRMQLATAGVDASRNPAAEAAKINDINSIIRARDASTELSNARTKYWEGKTKGMEGAPPEVRQTAVEASAVLRNMFAGRDGVPIALRKDELEDIEFLAGQGLSVENIVNVMSQKRSASDPNAETKRLLGR